MLNKYRKINTELETIVGFNNANTSVDSNCPNC